MTRVKYTTETLKLLRESLMDERRAEHGTAELDIEAAMELVRLASLALEVGGCGANYLGPSSDYVEVQIDLDLWHELIAE